MKPISETDLEQLSAYLDGELSDSERRFFQKRLSEDSALREACERAWIATSVLKAQPFQLMPSGSAAQICAQCPGSEQADRQPWRLVASVAALAVVLGLGYQLTRDSAPNIESPLQAKTAPQAMPDATPVTDADPAVLSAVPAKTIASKTPITNSPAQAIAVTDDPAQFVLNDATRSKAWPKRDQAMDDYLARHHQMTENVAGSDLITYAQWVTEPELNAEIASGQQDKK